MTDVRTIPKPFELWVVFRATLLRNLILMRRYWFDTVVQTVFSLFVFALIFVGGQYFGGAEFAALADEFVAGYFLFVMGVVAYRSIGSGVRIEATRGTLEQISMTPLGLQTIITARSLANLLLSFLISAVMLVIVLLATGVSVRLDLVSLIPLGFLTILPICGVGYAVAGLALLYKKVNSIFFPIQYAFVLLIAAPVIQYPILKALPVALGSYHFRQVIAGRGTLLSVPPIDLAIIVVTSVGYALVGFYAFGKLKDEALRRGVISQY